MVLAANVDVENDHDDVHDELAVEVDADGRDVPAVGPAVAEAESFNQPLNDWNVSNVGWMCQMFEMEKVRIGMTDSTFFYLSRG